MAPAVALNLSTLHIQDLAADLAEAPGAQQATKTALDERYKDVARQGDNAAASCRAKHLSASEGVLHVMQGSDDDITLETMTSTSTLLRPSWQPPS